MEYGLVLGTDIVPPSAAMHPISSKTFKWFKTVSHRVCKLMSGKHFREINDINAKSHSIQYVYVVLLYKLLTKRRTSILIAFWIVHGTHIILCIFCL